ncbi:MAG: hypothetical protein V8T85_15845 [Blautia faecicola]
MQSGEATSNATIQIPQIQQNLLERVAEVNENIAVVLFSGRPLDLRDHQSKGKSYPGGVDARNRRSRSNRRCSVWSLTIRPENCR